MTNTVQMNTRIDADLKRAGDAALAQAGYTPTQAVRALWTFAARHAGQPNAVREGLAFGDEEQDRAAQDAEIQRKLAIAERASHSFERFLISMGATPEQIRSLPVDERPYDQLIDEAYEELLAERGYTA